MGSVVKILVVLTALFRLKLAAAIDLTKDVEGQDCSVVEPLRNYTFHLKGLRTDLGYHVHSYDLPETFSFNVCGGLPRKCNNQEATACMELSSGKEVVLGYLKNTKLLWNDGLIRFSYTGEKCDDKTNYTMNVMLHCDNSESKNDFLGAFHETGQCESTVVFRTSLACLSVGENLKNPFCIAKSPSGDIFNFNSLRNYNHIAHGRNGTKFIIGICNPILYGHEATCEAGTSICLFDPKAKDVKSQFKNMGIMTEDFKYEKDFISLTMSSNESCDNDRKYKSKILFECDTLANVSYPTFHSSANCTHMFTWPTSLACLDKKSCQVVNPETGVSFDFSPLSGVQYEAINRNNTEEKIIFSICSQAEEPCIKKMGSCVVKEKNQQSAQTGIANDNLMLEKDGKNPYLLYENGAACKKLGYQFTTRINFICADSVKDEEAIVVEDGCNIVIDFKTLLACNYIRSCVTKSSDDEEIDLRPLIDYDGNYIATVNEKALPNEVAPVQYLINVCRPLNSMYSLNCRGSAGACRTVIEKDGKHGSEISLGHPDSSLTTMKKNTTYEVMMMYFDGSKCPTDNTENTATAVRFFCDHSAGIGNPILVSIDHCMYSFDFPTNILCNEQKVQMQNESCSLVNEKISASIDLKLFGTNGTYQVEGKDVSICGGTGKFYTIVYKQSLVRIEFSYDNTDIEIQLKCSSSNKTSTKVDDRILVMHEGPLICPLLKINPKAAPVDLTPDNIDTEEKTTSSGFTLGYVFLVFIVIIAFIAFYLVLKNSERREIISNLVKFRSTTSPVQYSRVRIYEESLLLNSNVACISDSEDDDILL